jgi:hypothetical membrane protein
MDVAERTHLIPRAFAIAFSAAWASLVAFWSLIVGSIVIANVIYPGANWYKPSLSHFGEAGAVTAFAYNGLQMIAALAMLVFAFVLTRACTPLEAAGQLRRWQRLGLGGVIGLLAVSLATIALLPYNLGGTYGWPVFVAHNIAGWTAAVAPATAIVLLPWVMPILRRGFYVFSWACLVPLLVIWYLFVFHHAIPQGITELIAYGVLAVWSFSFLAELQRAERELRG